MYVLSPALRPGAFGPSLAPTQTSPSLSLNITLNLIQTQTHKIPDTNPLRI